VQAPAGATRGRKGTSRLRPSHDWHQTSCSCTGGNLTAEKFRTGHKRPVPVRLSTKVREDSALQYQATLVSGAFRLRHRDCSE